MKNPSLRLVLASTCTERKSPAAGDCVRLRDVPLRGPAARARSWASALKRSRSGYTRADLLYQGGHWTATRRAVDAAREAGFGTELWVISAGYGLYPGDSSVPRYAATFNSGHKDSVVPDEHVGGDRVAYLTNWWAALPRHLPIRQVRTRTFERIAKKDPRVRIIVIAGQAYLTAITQDLCDAVEHLSDPGHLVVISGGTSPIGHPLSKHMVPIDARFQRHVGGTRSALNARVACWLLESLVNPGQFSANRLRQLAEATAADLQDIPYYGRTPMSDAKVVKWIRKASGQTDRPSASSLLRVFRDGGLACEQKRFSKLFKRALGKAKRRR